MCVHVYVCARVFLYEVYMSVCVCLWKPEDASGCHSSGMPSAYSETLLIGLELTH